MSYTIKSKTHLVGLVINVGELLEGIKDERFKDADPNAPILLHETSNESDAVSEPLTSVYKCGSCDKIHFESGWFDLSDALMSNKSIVYQDYRDKKDKYISRKELIKILSKIEKKGVIAIGTTKDYISNPLTLVVKCSDECDAVHLMSGYDKNSVSPSIN